MPSNELEREILLLATTKYLESDRFNGFPIRHLQGAFKGSENDLITILARLIDGEEISVVYGDRHPNPHIRAFADEPKEKQIEKLSTEKLSNGCIYPLRKHLDRVVDRNNYQGKPYTLELALGAPNLDLRFFDLMILETYRNDPRYSYRSNDISGEISITDKYYKSRKIRERDQILLRAFGFAYNKKMIRSVTVPVWYLSCLSPEHQQIWKSRELKGRYYPHPDYYRTHLVGDWPEKVMIFSAFLKEIQVINEACEAIGWPPLFKNGYKDNRPRDFAFLVRPTKREYCHFVHLLDKLLSENINRGFFKNKLTMNEEIARADKKVEVRSKGTIALLSEWIATAIRITDNQSKKTVKTIIKTLKDIRKERSLPGHSVIEDEFDQRYFRRQRKLMVRAYIVVKALRTLFLNHPSAAGVKVDRLLQEGKIWDI